MDALDYVAVGRTATTTIRGDGVASTLPFASTTMITATTASTTNLWISGINSGSLLKTTTAGAVTAAIAGTDYAAASSIFGKSWEVSGSFLSPTTTTYVTNIQQASSTIFSALTAKFGATATSTFTSTGALGIGTSTPWANLSIHAGAGENSFAIGSSTATYFLVNSSGNVGIGTTNPVELLNISSAASAANLRFDALLAASSTIRFADATNGLDMMIGRSASSRDLSVFSGTGAPYVTFQQSSGNVGIGTTSPFKTLSVAGDINFTGKLYEDGVEILSSMIAPFATACPTGWSEYTAARGRTVVGTPSSGTNEGTVGTALTNLGTRTTTDNAAHTHAVDPPNTTSSTDGAHTHSESAHVTYNTGTNNYGEGATSNSQWNYAGTTGSAGSHSHTVDVASFTSGSTGVASVDVTMPYIQLTYCQKAAGADIAEWMPASEDITKETIVSADPNNREKAVASSREYDGSVIGIVATKPGWLLGQEAKGSVQLALAGRVPVRVSLKNGEIKPGDPITTSSIPGVGMKATRAGSIVGKAMEAVNETSSTIACTDPSTGKEESCATALVFVNVSWYSPTSDTVDDDYTTQVATSYYEPLGVNGELEDGDVADLYYDYPPKQGHPNETEKLGHIGKAETEEAQSLRVIAGVISTKIGGPGELLRRTRENNKIAGEIRLITNGKAEMNIAPDSPAIESGNPISRSRTREGMGTKATGVGFTIGRALEAWTAGSGKEKISVMIDASWYDPIIFERYAPYSATTSALELISGNATALHPWKGAFASASESLKSSISSIANMAIHFLGRAVYATVGVFDKIFAKEIVAENVSAQELCARKSDGTDVCVTGEQLEALLNGQVAGAAAAGGSGGNNSPAPEPEPAPESEPTGNATTTPGITPPTEEPAAVEPPVEETSEPDPSPAPEPAPEPIPTPEPTPSGASASTE